MKTEKLALLLLRYGLGMFLLLWGIDKLIAPESTVKIFDIFYLTSISVSTAKLVGVAEIILSVLILLGRWKTWTYGLGLVLHGISTLSTYGQLLDPFGKNHLFIAAIPVLAAFLALFLLRKKDTMWTF